MRLHRESDVLDLWERSVGLDRWRRDDALLGGHATAPRRLGARNLALLAVRNAHFHAALPLRSACPGCGAEVEFTVDAQALSESLAAAPARDRAEFEWRGAAVAARPPTVDDLRAAAMEGTPNSVARAVLSRCVDGIDAAVCDEVGLTELGDCLEALDPAAAVEFDLSCPDCAHAWSAPLDIAEALWGEVRGAAERLLLEVDTLARAYGWTEAEVLALSSTRRAAYLQMAEAE
ncbi:hypothetical protein [Mesorhizobium sp. 1B3]|uniref:hypothetical protein n=1 Tax=Mesorhizobium sp. 1B3 TaxID=3243599 RepID=UPI003D982AE6